MSADRLIQWNANRPILYPWISESNPYRILLSEFLLQQTRSDQALGYYKRMLKAFPTIKKLAQASEDELMKNWQGLGYYSRARNLHKTAKAIVESHGGKIPSTYDELIQLPGIGPYTAAAISSFAFGERRVVVDGNVYRVLSRYHSIDTPINSSSARKEFTKVADDMLADSEAALFNQAIMNLGAHICTPKNPDCAACPFQEDCSAYADGTMTSFPMKKKKKPSRERFFHFIDIHYRGRTLIQKREGRDIWNSLYQFPLIERKSTRALSKATLNSFLVNELGLKDYDVVDITSPKKQVLSHQNIHSRFYQIKAKTKAKPASLDLTLVFRKNLGNFAFPRTVSWYLNTLNHDQ